MNPTEELKFKRADGMLAAALLLAAAVLFTLGGFLQQSEAGSDKRVRVYRDGEEVLDAAITEELNTPVFSEDDGENIISIRDGKVCVESANCPGQDCVKMGWISQPGEEIICLPHKLVIRIEGGEGDVDALAR
ncbi:MAG: NusG domain II-containing protein [Lachnospiraceae bacterium]|nr:NusG domain II-containing protein [Lachnospiraceae bacterium]